MRCFVIPVRRAYKTALKCLEISSPPSLSCLLLLPTIVNALGTTHTV